MSGFPIIRCTPTWAAELRRKPGGTLGIIGPTGSGKTTVLSLLQRFYDPDEGRSCSPGYPCAAWQRCLRSRIGVVLQSDFLMADTIDANIRFGREISADSVHQAARTAQADFILQKEDGFDTRLRPAAPT